MYSKHTSFNEQSNQMTKHFLGNRHLIRAINRSTVLNTIKTHASISRAEIARITGLSAATVTGITAELIQKGLIFEKAEGDSRGGRRPILLALNPRGGFVIGIKLMEDHAIGAITDLETTVLAKYSEDFQNTSLEDVIDTLINIVDMLLKQVDITQEQLLGIGIGVAGIVDARNGILRNSPFLGWKDVPLEDLLNSRIQVPVHIDNDVNTLTLTEQLFGAGQGIENFLVLTVGRGVGMGMVINGQLYRGVNGGGGEFGHTVIDPEGPLCTCGKSGCIETYVSEPALLQMVTEASSRGEFPRIINTIEDLITIAKEGNSVAISIFTQAGEKLGYGVANLINVLSPELIIISGEGIRAGDLLFTPMKAEIAQHVMPGLAEDTEIRFDTWEDDAWARCAAGLVLLELFKSPIERGKGSSIQ
jgi:glucokinase-like ROK family protein